MKRSLYVCLSVALLITTPVAAQRANKPGPAVRARDVITSLTAAPGNAWEAFVAMLIRAERSVTTSGVLSEPPGNDDDTSTNGVLSEPPGEKQDPAPTNP